MNPAALCNNKAIAGWNRENGEEDTQRQPLVLPAPYRAASDAQPVNPPVKKKQNDLKPPSQMWDIYSSMATLKLPNVVREPTRCGDHNLVDCCGFLTTKKENIFFLKRPLTLCHTSLFPSFLMCLIILEAVWAVNSLTVVNINFCWRKQQIKH